MGKTSRILAVTVRDGGGGGGVVGVFFGRAADRVSFRRDRYRNRMVSVVVLGVWWWYGG